MWNIIKNLFQRRTLLNRLNACRKFYTAKMASDERAMKYASKAWLLADDRKAVEVNLSDRNMAMKTLCGLPAKFEHPIVAIDVVADDDRLPKDFVKRQLFQEEPRISGRASYIDLDVGNFA